MTSNSQMAMKDLSVNKLLVHSVYLNEGDASSVADDDTLLVM